jgi:hypothetical protein
MLAKKLILIIITFLVCSCNNDIRELGIEKDLAIITIDYNEFDLNTISIINILTNRIIKEIRLPSEILDRYNSRYKKVADNFVQITYYKLLYQFYNDNIYIFENGNGTNILKLNIHTENVENLFYSNERYNDFQIIGNSIFLLHYDERDIDDNYFIEYDLFTKKENKYFIKLHLADFAIDSSKNLMCILGFHEEFYNQELYLYNIKNRTLESLNIKAGFYEITHIIDSIILTKGQRMQMIDISKKSQQIMPFDKLFDGIIIPDKYFIFEQWNNNFFNNEYITTFYISKFNGKKKYYLFKSNKKTIIGYINYDGES